MTESTLTAKPKGEPSPNPAATPGDKSAKPKTAKELKKEKRAAAVAARGGGTRPDGPPEGFPKGPRSAQVADSSDQAGPSTPGSPASTSKDKDKDKDKDNENKHADVLATINAPVASTSSTTAAHVLPPDLFYSHLPCRSPPDLSAAHRSSKLHPAVIDVGIAMSGGEIRGANARTVAMLSAFKEVIEDYECPEQSVLWKDLPNHLSPMIAWLEDCRPKGVGGGNAIRWLKSEINRLGEVDLGTEAEQITHLVESIDVYLRNRIEYADQIIASHAQEKIHPGDTIVTYARSSVVEKVLLEAWQDMRDGDPEASFNVVVVDSRPLNEGCTTLSTLTSAGIPCTYTLLPLASSILAEADLVLVGASALHSDGALYSRAGTSVICMLAKEYRVPVVACVETYKFGERVVLDGVASNEVDTSVDLLLNGPRAGKGGKGLPAALTPLSLMYDLTPSDLITTLCTELGFIPPSSVPTVLGKTSVS